jgi:hypothetical protein
MMAPRKTPFMKSFCVALFALQLAVSQASAFIEVTAEIVPYREQKETGSGTLGGSRSGGSSTPVTVSTKPSKAGGENQPKMLTISVHNGSKRLENELIVRYWFIGRDMKTLQSTLVDGGESSANLKPHETLKITSDSVKGSVTRKPASPGKMGEASGVKIAGYAVQVIRAGKIVAETYQESAYKKVIGSEGKNPGPFFRLERPETDSQ